MKKKTRRGREKGEVQECVRVCECKKEREKRERKRERGEENMCRRERERK